jgi:hypothetical protein
MKRSGLGRHLGIGFVVVLLASFSIGWGPRVGRGCKSVRSGRGAGGSPGRKGDFDTGVPRNSGCGSGRRANGAARRAPSSVHGHSGHSPSTLGYSSPALPPYVGERIALHDMKNALVMAEESELPLELVGSGLSRSHLSEHIEVLAHLETSSTHPPVTQVRLLALIPDSPSGFHHVFQRSMSKQDAKILAQLRSRRVDVGSETWIDSDLFGQRQLSAKMKSYGDSETVVIMAHSTKDGKSLRLPDGSEIDAVGVHRLCRGLGKQCIIITCNGQELGIRGNVTIAEAYGMWKAAHALVGTKRVTSLGELAGTMQKARSWSRHHQRLAIIGVVSASGVVYWIHARLGSSKGNAGVARRCTSTSAPSARR